MGGEVELSLVKGLMAAFKKAELAGAKVHVAYTPCAKVKNVARFRASPNQKCFACRSPTQMQKHSPTHTNTTHTNNS